MNLKELYEARANNVKQAQELRDTAKSDGRDMSADEIEAMNEHLDEAESLGKQIEEQERAAKAYERLEQASATVDTPGTRQTSADPYTTNPSWVAVRDNIEADPRHGFRHFGEFAAAVHASGVAGNPFDKRLLIGAAAGTGMNQAIGSEGGFAVPPEFNTTIWDGVRNSPNALLPMTDNYSITGESLTLLANAETSRAAGSRYGGIRGYWISELAQMTSSYPKLREIKVEPNQLAVFAYVSEKLLKNASALSTYLTKAATEEISFMVNDAIINGTGAGQPQGILTSACLVSVTKETGQAADTLVPANIAKMWSRMVARSRSNAIWLINQDIEPQLLTMTLDTGASGMPVYMPPGGFSGSPYATLLGRPVIPCESSATLGDKGDIILADMKGYLSATRGGVDSAMSIHLKFDYNQSCFRWLFEVDGQPWLASTLTPFKGTDNTQSTFVTLNERA